MTFAARTIANEEAGQPGDQPGAWGIRVAVPGSGGADAPWPVSAVCLDVDDTLVDYAGAARAALRVMLARDRGIDAVWPIWQQLSDEHAAAVIAGDIAYEGMHVTRTMAFFAAIGESLDRDEAWRREQTRAWAMRQAWQVFADVGGCLDWLRAAGLAIAVVTNASGAHQRTKLADLGLADAFDAVVIAGEAGAAKPDPVIFHTACAWLGSEPSRTVHVGDKLDADAMGAMRAGLHGVWLDREGPSALAAPRGVSVINSLALLPELLVCDLPSSLPSALPAH